jgi:hypothetical protein
MPSLGWNGLRVLKKFFTPEHGIRHYWQTAANLSLNSELVTTCTATVQHADNVKSINVPNNDTCRDLKNIPLGPSLTARKMKSAYKIFTNSHSTIPRRKREEKTILRRNLKKYVVWLWTGFIWLKIGTSFGIFWTQQLILRFYTFGKVHDQIDNNQLLHNKSKSFRKFVLKSVRKKR